MSDAPSYGDRLPAPDAGEAPVLAVFAPDRDRYIRDSLTWTAILGVGTALVVLALGRGEVLWAAILGVLLAMAVRGVWFYADAMKVRWLLTPDALIGPGNDVILRADITTLRSLMGDVQVVTRGGRKRLIRNLADPAGVIAAIRSLR